MTALVLKTSRLAPFLRPCLPTVVLLTGPKYMGGQKKTKAKKASDIKDKVPKEHNSTLLLEVSVQPSCQETRVASVGEGGCDVRIRLAAPPVDGQANRELAKFLSTVLAVPGDAVSVTRGVRGRHKTVAIQTSLDKQEALQRLTEEL
jgi:uncharacterized protein (TIGR00251 family)